MSTVALEAPKRKVGILLFIGILLLPIVFAWFLLRKGHSTLSRVLGFGWLLIVILSIASQDTPTPTTTSSSQSAPATTPEASEVAPPKSEPVNSFAEDAAAVEQIEQRIKDNRESLKKYYGSADQIKQATQDIIQLAIIKVTYGENGKTKEDKALGQKAAALIPQVEQQAREIYASSLKEIFIKSGMDVDVRVSGKEKKQIRVVYALMSEPLVYKFQNEIKLDKQAEKLGFTKLIYTNGFESSLGKTWTVDLGE
jgi:hypothetical protein